MSQPSSASDRVIRQMLRPVQTEKSSISVALEVAADDLFRRAFKAVHNLDVSVEVDDVCQMTLPQALKSLPELRMIAVIENASDQLGLLVFDATLLDALIEVQTVGEVLDLVRTDRPVTDIDCAMAEPLMMDVLERCDGLAKRQPELSVLSELSFDRVERDMVRLSLDLLSPVYDHLSVTIDLGPGVKTGRVSLLLPGQATSENPERHDASFNPAAVSLLAPYKIRLDAWLPPTEISIASIKELSVGDCLPIDRASLADARLTTAEGRVISEAQLGQRDGYRAVRLGAPSTASSVVPTAGDFTNDPAQSSPELLASASGDMVEASEEAHTAEAVPQDSKGDD